MRGTLDLRKLRYFQVIADCGSISAAARFLNLAQPALSYHVAELERLTGHTLFNRNRDGVKLTEAGRLLRRHASLIVAQVEEAENALEQLTPVDAPAAGRVSIAIISSLAAGLTPLLVERVGRELPGVTLRIVEAGTQDIAQKLERGEADLAIYLASASGRVDAPIAHEQLYHVAPPGTVADGDCVALADLARAPLVMPGPGNPLRSYMEVAAHQHGLRLDIVLEVDGSRSRLNAVRNGIGGTIVGARSIAVGEAEPGLVVRRIIEPTLSRPIYLGGRRELNPHLASRMRRVVVDSLITLGLGSADV